MKNIKHLLIIASISILYGCSGNISTQQTISSQIQLPALFSDNMVLQRNIDIPIWGTATPNTQINIYLNDQSKDVKVSPKGDWMVRLSPLSAGGPYELKIIGRDTLTFKNVMIGEVWLASGQSNMEMPVHHNWGHVNNYEKEIIYSNYPNIRFFHVEHTTSNSPQNNINSSGWTICNPKTLPPFSATAYFFGRDLHEKLNVPIGLIHSSWGGTVIEAWTNGKSLKNISMFTDQLKIIENEVSNPKLAEDDYLKQLHRWKDDLTATIANATNGEDDIQSVAYDISDWDSMNIPTLWQDAGLDYNGIVWFRKEVHIPSDWDGEDLILNLGPINDYDFTYFNGTFVGCETHVSKDRSYSIPAELVKPGEENIIAVQVIDIGNVGGIFGKPEQLTLDSKTLGSISIAGTWKYQIDPAKFDIQYIPAKPVEPYGPNRPSVLYNGMIHPLIPYGMRGVIWYQGESNASRAHQYQTLFPTLINNWRNNWGQGDFPFLFVQLANFKTLQTELVQDDWAELREAQLMTLALPNTGMAVAIDIGDAEDIHPRNKQDVGQRLALNAMSIAYGESIVHSGPIYESMKIEKNKIRLSFKHIGSGLISKSGEKLTGFAIAGDNQKFHWANAIIEGETITVFSDKVQNPVSVRYAWAANPICNLYNKAGLPASPFRTDSWKGITE